MKKEILKAISKNNLKNAKEILTKVYGNESELVISDGLFLHVFNDDTMKGVNLYNTDGNISDLKLSHDFNYPEYQQIIKDSVKVNKRFNLKLLIKTLQTIQALGYESVEIGGIDSTDSTDYAKPVYMKGKDRSGHDDIKLHKVSLLMPMMLEDKEINTNIQGRVDIKEEVKEVVKDTRIGGDDDLPF